MAWRVGEVVEGHHLLQRLGEGGMGVVFLARELETGREVAIKTLSVGGGPGLIERFRREGQAHARVDRHPNVVRVHSAGEHEGHLFLVLDRVEGEDLGAILRRGPLEPERARELVIALADALAHVHAHGILHRDLKPANVILTPEGEPKLLDFGVARVADRSSLTATGEVVGTIAYMAPEQLDDSKRVDARADVYGLGAILYAALTGGPPFRAEGQIALMKRVFDDAPEPPSRARPEVPPDLEATCLLALAKDPDARVPSAIELARRLRERVQPTPPPVARAPLRIPARPLIGILLGALALVVLGFGLEPLLGRFKKPYPGRYRAVETLVQLQRAQSLFHESDPEGDGVKDYATLEELLGQRAFDPVQLDPVYGYRFEVRFDGQPETRYYVIATPNSPGTEYDRGIFYADMTGRILETSRPAAGFLPPDQEPPRGLILRSAR